MATFKSANTQYEIPGAEVFRGKGADDSVYIRSGNNLYVLNIPSIGFKNLVDSGKYPNPQLNGPSGQEQVSAGMKAIQEQLGVDFNSLPEYNQADITQAITSSGGKQIAVDIPSFQKIVSTLPDAKATTGNIDISQGQTFDQSTGQLKDSTGKVMGTAQPNANQTIPKAPTDGVDISAPVVPLAPPSTSLKPGDTGDQVKKLQDYLVSKGLMTQAQVDTGYGTYGPQTTAAVAALQKSLGVDNSTGVGYFGPRTIQAVSTNTTGTSDTSGITPVSVHPELLQILDNPNLSADQKASIQAIYNAVTSNDTNTAERIQSAMKAASEYSDPYFKAQIQLATDALQRGISGKEGDLAYQETSLKNALKTLQESTAASKDQLSFQHAQELKQLADKYQTDLSNTQDSLAATGFTSSSKRARAEQILADQNAGLVESSNKGYSYQTGNLDRTLNASDVNTQNQIENLRRLTSEGKLDLLRTGESQVGTKNLADLGYTGLLGNVGGEIPRTQTKDALSFANSFVF